MKIKSTLLRLVLRLKMKGTLSWASPYLKMKEILSWFALCLKMKGTFLWLTLRLMKKQRLRTATVFYGIFCSVFLLSMFGRFGYYFWDQVHEGASAATEYDSTQWILAALVTVLLVLIVVCSVILLYNLCSLTFVQKWRSLSRLVALGATGGNVLSMVVTEISILYCGAAFAGVAGAVFFEKWTGIQTDFPIWITAGILIWTFLVSCICGVKPVLHTLRSPLVGDTYQCRKLRECRTFRSHRTFRNHRILQIFHMPGMRRRGNWKEHGTPIWFPAFMADHYFRANRGHYVRMVISILSVIVLYVPVSYLITTNLDVQQAELHKKYGIQYRYAAYDYDAINASLKECQNLAGKNVDGDSVLYVLMPGRVSVKSELLDGTLLDILEEAGWSRQEIWEADSDIYFLDERHYERYRNSCMPPETFGDTGGPSVILVNRYINRTSYKEGGDQFYPDTQLVDADRCQGQGGISGKSGIQIYYGMGESVEEQREDATQRGCSSLISEEMSEGVALISEEMANGVNLISEKMPEGIDFSGKVTIIVPLSQLAIVCASGNKFGRAEVCGCFEDHGTALFQKLQQELGPDGMGRLVYSRKVFQDWYDSMNEIHLAMAAICAMLFFIALLNSFSTMIFQFLERRRSLAILWSLGQTEKGLLRILILENVRYYAFAIIAGIPVSCGVCYYIYGIFRPVWRINFILPFGQIVLIVTAAAAVSAVAMLINDRLIKSQNFLQNIRDFT